MKYIDFDDVIMNSSEMLIKAYYNNKAAPDSYFKDDDFIINYDWNKLLKESKVINNAIEIIKEFDPKEVCILTKILSLDNEGGAKIKFLRDNGIKCNIMLVPEHSKKTDVVDPKGCILIDDSLNNLEDWESHGGIPIFFDRFNKNQDGWGKQNTKYKRTDTLEMLKEY